MADIDEILTRGLSNIIPNIDELKRKLESVKINIYFGIDPTATKIHLGNTVPLRKLQKLAELGHNVTFLIGDSTALIGDTSDKESERPSLTKEKIGENFKTYKRQAEKILDFSKVKVRHNSEWLSKLNFEEIIKLLQNFSLGDFISRELIKKRLGEKGEIGLHEAIYPAIQAYDSWYLKTDLQIGGTDQTFNMQAGRTLIKNIDKRESFVLTTPILEGTDGRKMSKSYGNAIWLDDDPNDMYAKTMAVEDRLIINYFTLVTNVSDKKIKNYEENLKKDNPINIKKELAFEIVKELYDEKSANEAQKNFKKTVQDKEQSTEVPVVEYSPGTSLSKIATDEGLVASNSEWKRLIDQNGIKKNNEALNDANEVLSNEITLQRGRKTIKVKLK